MKKVPTPEFIPQGQPKTTSSSYKYDIQEDAGSGFPIEPPRGAKQNGFSHSNSMIHPCAAGSSLNKNVGNARNNVELRTQKSHMPQATVDMSNSSLKKNETAHGKDSSVVKNQLTCSVRISVFIFFSLHVNEIVNMKPNA